MFNRRLPATASFIWALAFAVWAAEPAEAAEADPGPWPQWRGGGRDGRIADADWPDRLGPEHLKLKWRVKLGRSYSGPIVSADRVFTTASENGQEVVLAYRRDNGELLWKNQWTGSMRVPFFAARNGSWIRSTPAWDGRHLYVAGMRDVLVCLDGQTGRKEWSVDLTRRHGTPLPSFGFVCSPLLEGDFVYVQAGGGFVKMNKKTGKNLWRGLADGGGMWASAFSSPILATLAGQKQAVVQTRNKLAGVDPASGAVLWEKPIKAFRGMNILTPTVVGPDSIFTSSYGGRSQLIRLLPDGARFKTEVVWTNKLQGYMSSPVVVDGHLYMHLRNQRLACVELKTGRIRWVSSKLYGKYWSMVTDGRRILGLDQEGVLYLMEADPEKLKIVGSQKISDTETWAHVALAGDQVFIRELNGLACWKWAADRKPNR